MHCCFRLYDEAKANCCRSASGQTVHAVLPVTMLAFAGDTAASVALFLEMQAEALLTFWQIDVLDTIKYLLPSSSISVADGDCSLMCPCFCNFHFIWMNGIPVLNPASVVTPPQAHIGGQLPLNAPSNLQTRQSIIHWNRRYCNHCVR